MTTSKHLWGIMVVALLATAPFIVRRVWVQHKIYAASSPVQPFVLQQHLEVVNKDIGFSASPETRTIAMKSDGTRVDVIREAKKGWTTREIRYSDGLYQMIYDDAKVLSSYRYTPDEMFHRLNGAADPNSGCSVSVNGVAAKPPHILQGYETKVGLRVSRVLDSNGFVKWHAPALKCVEMEHFMDWNPDKPGTNTSHLLADSVTLKEPDSILFTVPGDYTELSPSKAVEKHLRASVVPIPESGIQQLVANWAQRDSFYATHRP
jgi:hypothetical protein